jgi:transposase-like protein
LKSSATGITAACSGVIQTGKAPPKCSINTPKNRSRAPSEEAGRAALERFGEAWQAKYPLTYKSCDAAWPELCEFFKYPDEIRRVMYTTNAIESLNYQLRKVTGNRSVLAGDGAIYKIMYLALRNAAKKWTMPIPNWGAALNQFSLFFGERVPLL